MVFVLFDDSVTNLLDGCKGPVDSEDMCLFCVSAMVMLCYCQPSCGLEQDGPNCNIVLL